MKKIICIAILTLVILNVNGCKINSNNLEGSEEVSNKKTIEEVREYSFITPIDEEIQTKEISNNKLIKYISKGRPSGQIDNKSIEVYVADQRNTNIIDMRLYLPLATKNEYIETFIGDGDVFRVINNDYISQMAVQKSIIDFNDAMSENKIDTIAWFDDILLKEGHIFGISKGDSSIYRQTFHSNEFTILVNGKCENMQYWNGRLYYIKNSRIFSINIDGTDNELVNDGPVTDYIISKDGIYYCEEHLKRATIL